MKTGHQYLSEIPKDIARKITLYSCVYGERTIEQLAVRLSMSWKSYNEFLITSFYWERTPEGGKYWLTESKRTLFFNQPIQLQ